MLNKFIPKNKLNNPPTLPKTEIPILLISNYYNLL